MKVLAVIPARGNSKGIPRKNMRMMNGKPLLSYSIQLAKNCPLINDVVVTSEDEEILGYAQRLGVDGLPRTMDLSGDAVTLDPVIYDAVVRTEEKTNGSYDYIITLQPTSPLLTAKSLENAIKTTVDSNLDTLISATNKPCLSWRKEGRRLLPNYTERLNRQQLPEQYVEAGAFVISRREVVKPNSRIGKAVNIYELREQEGIDIDTIEDWVLCETLIKRKRIVLRTDGYRQLGMGHIYRCLTLAYALTEHEICFVLSKEHKAGIEKIAGSFFPYFTIETDQDFYLLLQNMKPDIVIHDLLDTQESYMKEIKSRVKRVVTFEDLGPGTSIADAVVNALYQNSDNRPHVYTGHKYVCLRDEFFMEPPKAFSAQVANVLVMFGGSDPCNLTQKLYQMVCNHSCDFTGIQFNFITGLAYDPGENHIISCPEKNIYVHSNTNRVSWYMQQADLAFTSQGRGTFELASLGIPAVVMAQNERERSHSFASLENGFLNLGLGAAITEQTLYNTLRWMVDTPQIRKEMRGLMLNVDLKQGINRVKKIILNEVI